MVSKRPDETRAASDSARSSGMRIAICSDMQKAYQSLDGATVTGTRSLIGRLAWSACELGGSSHHLTGPSWQTARVDDEELLSKAEEALTEIKVAHGLSERHASVLAALRIRLKGSAGKSLEEMLTAAGDVAHGDLGEKLTEVERKRKPSLDDLMKTEPKKPEWPS